MCETFVAFVEEGTMWKEIPPFSFSAGERKIMAHSVVR